MSAREIANEKILHGLISLYILRELLAAPMHGYELGKKIASATGKYHTLEEVKKELGL